MSGYRIDYKPLADSNLEIELASLAAVYRFLLDRHERRKDARDDGTEKEAEHGE